MSARESSRKGEETDTTKLFKAAFSGDHQEVQRLLPTGSLLASNPRGLTALMVAAWRGHERCVELLAPKSNQRAVNANGSTALMLASARGSSGSISALLEGSDVNQQDAEGATALHYAAGANAATLSRLVAHRDIRIDAVNMDGENAMFNAVASSCPTQVDILLRAGACDVDRQNLRGDTALHFAARLGIDSIVEKLLPHCDPRITNRQGRSAADDAASEGHRALAERIAARALSVSEKALLEEFSSRRPSIGKDKARSL